VIDKRSYPPFIHERGGLASRFGFPFPRRARPRLGPPTVFTGVPRPSENATPWDPTVGVCLGPYGPPGGVALSYERGTPVDLDLPQCLLPGGARLGSVALHCEPENFTLSQLADPRQQLAVEAGAIDFGEKFWLAVHFRIRRVSLHCMFSTASNPSRSAHTRLQGYLA
jgi:hypothetical protein